MRFEERTSKRKALLEQILKETMEELRLKCFKYKRRPFLFNKVTIAEKDLNELEASGLYELTDKHEINPYKYTHNIFINTELLDNFFNYKWKNTWDSKHFNKKWYRKQIKATILHELCHAFVYEEFQDWCDVEGIHRDASPIFLATLKFLGGTSAHHAAIYFVDTQLYKDIKQITKYKDFAKYIIKLIHRYNRVTSNLTKIVDIREEKRQGTMLKNNFVFAHRSMGLRADSLFKNNMYSKDKKLNVFFCDFEIGSTIEPEQIEHLVNKKIANENFILVDRTKNYFINGERMVDIKIS